MYSPQLIAGVDAWFMGSQAAMGAGPSVVPAGPVRVAVRELLARRRAHLADLDVEMERLARQRVVGVELDAARPLEPHHRQDRRVAADGGPELHALLELADA